MELCGFSLYLGTTLGRIMRFRLAQDGDEQGRMSSAAKVAEKSMGPVRMWKTCTRMVLCMSESLFQKSPVTFVRSASALSRLLVLCDGVLSVLSVAEDGDGGGKVGPGISLRNCNMPYMNSSLSLCTRMTCRWSPSLARPSSAAPRPAASTRTPGRTIPSQYRSAHSVF